MTLEEAVKKDLNTALSELVQQAFWTGYKAATDKIVHCKDCKYNNSKSTSFVACVLVGEMYGREADNYCSLAEGKEE